MNTDQTTDPAGAPVANVQPGPVKAISLLSGGLDSILATRVVQDQGVEVLALKFITPFFGDDQRGCEDAVAARYRELYGIHMRVVDVSREYLTVLADPRYGYGKNFNPCIDCKIFLIRRAAELMQAQGAQFLITGEVLGQRPMSQRRDAMNAISKQTGVRDLLLRPLCALHMPITAPERHGWVDRERLYGFTGRNRKPQMALAAELGITEYPTPAGGCRLTDPNLSPRVRRYFEVTPAAERTPDAVRLLLTGRPFRLPGGSWFTMGRNEAENEAVEQLAPAGGEWLRVVDVPGPLGLLRLAAGAIADRPLAAAILKRYCAKAEADTAVEYGADLGAPAGQLCPEPLAEETLQGWRF